MWQGTITVTLENLPGLQDQTCWAVYTEVGITSALSCDGCDQIFEITRTLIDSDSICGWTQQELDIYALWASENRVDHHVGEEGLVLSPWLQIDSTELRWDEKEAAWFIHYTYRGHPTAGFNSTSARAQAFRLSLL